jgi:transposase-like protein
MQGSRADLCLLKGKGGVAPELVVPDFLHLWRRKHKRYEDNNFPGKGKLKLTDDQREDHEAQKAVKAKLECDSLKSRCTSFPRATGILSIHKAVPK